MNISTRHAIVMYTGLESIVYRLPDERGDLVLKKRTPDGKQQYRFEAFAYDLTQEQGVRVPQILFADDDTILMTALKGTEMDDRKELFGNAELFADIAGDLARCHAITLSGFGDAQISNGTFTGKYDDWRSFLFKTQSMLQDTKPVGNLTHDDLQVLQSYWVRMLPKVDLERGVLVHGDFAMSAIFVDQTKYSGLIDFGDALIGDPLLDVAYFRFKEITKPYGLAVYERLRDAYVTAKNTQWTSRDDDLIIFYMIFWGIRRLEHCPSGELRSKFADKLHKVSESI